MREMQLRTSILARENLANTESQKYSDGRANKADSNRPRTTLVRRRKEQKPTLPISITTMQQEQPDALPARQVECVLSHSGTKNRAYTRFKIHEMENGSEKHTG